ncbi:LysM peptidoglycan-binding domain-containing protein [Marivita sp. S6314]|uniref:LysM peptidoglycan-binding domain-containing protein n=1 Tax=Marivita sp. S6314 TaxID=2926406 RepID=UPI001FF328CE|nr:LysM peptidoglycan-binding domain-containing protein [Marivita sp. S6314]MCK0150898.1 LysM peptidoglycan-binding domain-containing protein [Marivita sp. S6314]
MGKFALTQGASGLALGGAAAVAAVVIGLYASGSLFPSSEPEAAGAERPAPAADPVVETPDTQVAVLPDPVSEPSQPNAPAPDVPETPDAAAPSDVDDADRAAPENTDAATTEPEAPVPDVAAPDPVPPAFDIVRVAPDGQTLVAGSAPGARDVRVLVDGVEAGSAVVDRTGKFVAFLDLPPSATPRVVGLVAEGDAGRIESPDQVILAPSVQIAEAPVPDVPEATSTDLAAAPETPQSDPASDAGPVKKPDVTSDTEVEERAPEDTETEVVADTQPETPTAQVEVAEATADPVQQPITTADPVETSAAASAPVAETIAETPSAPAVILSTQAGVEVLQPSGQTPDVLDQIALDAITYETAGDVALSGRGTVDEFVRVYIDNEPVLTTEVGEDGRWRADLPEIDSGTYTLRVDAVDVTGEVVSRVESPFRREDPAALAAVVVDAPGASVVKVVTVQPGNTLWAIARDRYGEGPAYVKVFEANRDRIRNPDLIYPGQVFAIPD